MLLDGSPEMLYQFIHPSLGTFLYTLKTIECLDGYKLVCSKFYLWFQNKYSLWPAILECYKYLKQK